MGWRENRDGRRWHAGDDEPGAPPGAGPVRSGARARRLRGRLRGGHQGPKVPRDREPGPHRAEEPPAPRRLRLRGEHGRRSRHPHPDAAPVPRARVRPARPHAARTGSLRGRPGLPAPRRRRARRVPGHPGADRGRGGAGDARLAPRPHRFLADRALRAGGGTGVRAGVHRPRSRRPRPGRLRAQALRHPQAGGARGPEQRDRRAEVLLPAEPLREHPHLQGHALGRPDRGHVPRRHRSPGRIGAGAGAPAVLHEHVPVVAARAPLPVHRSQRRDQHPPGQYQLDAGARAALPLRAAGRRPQEDRADRGRRRQRLGRLRQCARVPGDGGPAAAPGRAHDDPGSLERARGHERGDEGLLRVPRLPDGAVGRAGLHRLHRRHRDRRGARPQRPAPVALLRHQGRHGGDGLRGGRARHPAGARAPEGAAAPRADLPGGHRPGPDHRRRGAQAHLRGPVSLRGVAAGVSDARREPARAAPRPGAGSRDGAGAAAGLRLHPRGPAPAPGPDGRRGRGAGGLDGHRYLSGRALRAAAPALRLLQAALRPGDQSPPRRHPRGAGHPDRDQHRAGGQPARAGARGVPPDQAQDPDAEQRRAGAHPPREPARLQGHHRVDALPGRGRRRGPRAGHGRAVRAGESRGRGRLHVPDPVRSGDGRDPRADPRAPGHLRGPPPPDPGGHAVQGGARDRDGRGPRGAPHGPAAGLRGGRDQSLPRVREPRRHDPAGAPARPRSQDRDQELHQGAEQGRAQGDLQDGDLHHPLLPRRPDLRGDRPRQGARRPLLHLDRLPHQRGRARRRRPGSGGASPARASGAPGGWPRAGLGRRVPVAARRRVPPVQPGDRVQAPARHPERPVQDLQGLHAVRRRPEPEPRDPARPLPAARRAGAGAPGGGGARRGDRQALRHRGHVLRLHQPRGAPDARDRHEPPRRQVQYR